MTAQRALIVIGMACYLAALVFAVMGSMALTVASAGVMLAVAIASTLIGMRRSRASGQITS